jgi:diguanylate cyclase (GGDEF)-like protein
MRLEKAGDMVGEMSILDDREKNTTSVVAETESTVIAFSHNLFEVEPGASRVSVVYLIFTHILSEKLRITSARVMLEGNVREEDNSQPQLALVEGDNLLREQFASLIEKNWENVQLETYETPQTFLQSENQLIDLLIMDPGSSQSMNEIRDCILVSKQRARAIMIVSDFAEDTENRRLLSQWGVSEFLAKPCPEFDFEHALNRQRVIHYRERELKRVEEAADTDRLTGLANRRRLDEFVEALVTLYPEERAPFSLVISDVDNFKHYNDTHGHQMGDVVLARISGILKNRVRRGDLAARFGGEEFVVILPKCGSENAMRIAEQLRVAVEEEDIPYQDQQPLGNLTATFGVATFPEDADDVETLLKKADDCLYKGKESGRNVVISASNLSS